MELNATQRTTLDAIFGKLESQASYDAGLANEGSVSICDNTITFTYPAPVISGACHATIYVYSDGSIFEDICNDTFEDLGQWIIDFETLLKGA